MSVHDYSDGTKLYDLRYELDRLRSDNECLRAEIERLTSDLSGVTDECANLLKIKARLEADHTAVALQRDREWYEALGYGTQIRAGELVGIGLLSLPTRADVAQEIDRLRAEVERLTAERADTERIDWVEAQGKRAGWIGWEWEDEVGVIASNHTESWREVVDASRKAGEEPC